jgi:site-specific DNA recombinase
MRAIIYLRVSKSEQADSGLGLAAQLAAATKKAIELGVSEILPFTDPGVSGSTPIDKRPGLSQALAAVRKGDVLIVAKRDRLSRSMSISIAIEDLLRSRKAALISANGEGTGDTVENVGSLMEKRMFQVFAEVEKQMIKDRTRAALGVKKARGERTGNIPYGYQLADDGIHVEPNTEEQAVISIVGTLRGQGMTFYGIVAHLNHEGIPNRKGTLWQYRSVWNIVNSIAESVRS